MGCGSSNELEVLVFVGSLRKQSHNRGLIDSLINAPEFKDLGIKVHTPDLGEIPFFNEDLEKEKSNSYSILEIPSSVVSLRKLCAKSQLLLFITPEYNGSVSASVKNAYDWLSRPDAEYDNKPVVGGKCAGIMSTSWLSQTQAKDC